MKAESKFRIFLSALAVAGSLLVWMATSSYGPGLSTDGARYLSTAESIAAGRGIIDYLGLPLVNWPPLYPFLLAGLKLLTGLDVFALGQIINIVAFGAIIYLGGVFFERSMPGNWTLAYVASLVLATSLPLLEVSANIASDPLFLICVLLFLLAAQNYLRERNRGAWWQMAALAVAACFLRYAGLTLIISGTLIVFFSYRLRGVRTESSPTKKSPTATWGLPRFATLARNGWRAAGFGLVSGLPIAAFAILHNLPATGSLLGAHRPSIALTNFIFLFEKMAGWFLPLSWLSGLAALAIFALLSALLLAASNRTRRRSWLKTLQGNEIFPSLVFTLVYGAVLIFSISTSEHQVPGSQRIHAVLLPAFLVLAGSALQGLAPKLPRKIGGTSLRTILLAGFALWLLLPIYRVQAYVRASVQQGDVSYYNLYNTRTLRESDIVAHISSLEISGDTKVYSNNEGAAWFYLRRRIYRLPRYDAEAGEDLAAVMATFEGWPGADEQAMLVWFERELDYKEEVPTPEQMAEFIRLTPTFTGRYGDVYRIDVE
ncbi:MAG: hypothetical protein WD751_11640 [Anaerolineales bacterium]